MRCHFAETVRHEDDDRPRARKRMHPFEKFFGFVLGKRGVRLIEQENIRTSTERSCYLGLLVDRQWQELQLDTADASDVQLLHQRYLFAGRARPTSTHAFAADLNILRDREVGKQLRLLVHHSNAMAVERVRPARPSDFDIPAVGRFFPCEDPHHRALARPVWPRYTKDLPRRGLQVESVQCDRVAEPLSESTNHDATGIGHESLLHLRVKRSKTTAPIVTEPINIC